VVTAGTPNVADTGEPVTAFGIDVGASPKGFHAVAITDGSYAGHIASKDANELAHWCRVRMDARAIAIDAPCRWSNDGRARPAERELMKKGIWCFSTPTRQRALDRHLRWLAAGDELSGVLLAQIAQPGLEPVRYRFKATYRP
jgi:hypothetical protein